MCLLLGFRGAGGSAPLSGAHTLSSGRRPSRPEILPLAWRAIPSPPPSPPYHHDKRKSNINHRSSNHHTSRVVFRSQQRCHLVELYPISKSTHRRSALCCGDLMVERISGDFPLFVKRQRSSHQIIIPRASSVVRNNVVISLNPIQSPSQLIAGAPFCCGELIVERIGGYSPLFSSRGNVRHASLIATGDPYIKSYVVLV